MDGINPWGEVVRLRPSPP